MSHDIRKVIGNRIRHYRKRRGISQEELAHQSSLSVSFIGEVERSEKSPSLDNLNNICLALGITIQELFDHSQPKSQSREAELIFGIVNKIHPLPAKDLITIREMIDLMIKFKK